MGSKRTNARSKRRLALKGCYKSFFSSNLGQRDSSLVPEHPLQVRLDSFAHLPLYGHAPLSGSSCTRVLRIEPSDDFDAPLRGTVEEINLDRQHRAYICLSHSWGKDFVLDHVLLCSGRWYLITQRIDYAIRRIRRKANFAGFKVGMCIWIDAISIQQGTTPEALTEKNTQVGKIDQIFSSAVGVVVDLGPAGRLTPHLPASIDEFTQILYSDVDKSEFTSACQIYASHHEFDPPDIETETRRIARSLFAYADLASREWFGRLWTCLEIACSKYILYMIGDIYLDHQYVTYAGKTGPRAIASWAWYEVLSFPDRGSAALRKARLDNTIVDSSLFRLFGEGRFLRASQPRDYVFALLNLAKDGASFAVDYNESMSDFRRRLAMHFNASGGAEFVFHAASAWSASEDEASWEPYIGEKHASMDRESALVLRDYHDHAAGIRSIWSPLSICASHSIPGCIIARALVIDSIAALSAPFPKQNFDILHPPRLSSWRFLGGNLYDLKYGEIACSIWLINSVHKILTACPAFAEAHWLNEIALLTLCHGWSGDLGGSPTAKGLRFFAEDLLICDLWLSKQGFGTSIERRVTEGGNDLACWGDFVTFWTAEIENTFHSFMGLTREEQIVELRIEDAGLLLHPIGLDEGHPRLHMCLDQAICATETGRIAAVHETSRIGDKIMIIDGASNPFVMRPVGDCYRIVGTCYMRGIMDGEAMEGRDDDWLDIHVV